MIRNKRITKVISIILLISLLNNIINPVALLALTSGPASPEFSSYEPVATTDMVDIFTGDYTYNLPVVSIPGPDGGGYSLSLSYHSGVTPEEEASWVGLGWTLNPGAINRNKIGLPDDYKGANVVKYNKARPNWSASAKANVSVEIYSKQNSKDKSGGGSSNSAKKDSSSSGFSISLGLSKSIRFNNYRGYMKSFGFNAGVKGIASVGFERSGSGYSMSVNPTIVYSKLSGMVSDAIKDKIDYQYLSAEQIQCLEYLIDKKVSQIVSAQINQVSSYATRLIQGFSAPVASPEYKGISFNVDQGLGIFIYQPIGVALGFNSNFNLQVNKANNILQGYGYMYNPDRGQYDNENVLSDYYVEKAVNYDKKDKYLGIPHNGADNFMVTGEQITGGFRLFPKHIGHYYPSRVNSAQNIRALGFSLDIGAGIVGVGFTFGAGKQTNKVKQWDCSGDNPYQFKRNSKGIFRFSGDLGGDVSYFRDPRTTTPLSTEINLSNPLTLLSPVPYFGPFSGLKDSLGDVNRSSYIEYHTTKEIEDNPGIRLEKGKNIQDLLMLENIYDIDDRISEFAITNETGVKYIYGLPVYTMNNKNFSVDVNTSDIIQNNYLAFKKVYTGDSIFSNRVVLGETTISPYTVNNLLTQIVTPDYVDVGDNGPDEKDFGGWTKFNYRKWKSENDSALYHFRAPYNGLLYNEAEISTKYDDMGGITSGDKQVYYLKAIETKSHIAFFITNKTKASDFTEYTVAEISTLNGSGKKRFDQLGAVREKDQKDPAAQSNGLKDTTQRLEMLEKIVLYSKASFDKPVKTVYFDYDFSLCRNLPNSDGDDHNNGKLTLKRVWFESEGVVNSRIAPYKFEYNYAVKYPYEIAKKYPDIVKHAEHFTNQNPNYEPYSLDMWGNYQYDGAIRRQQRIPWVYQGNDVNESFDPAAWNLKRIILPSGGEIHIQYEQKDYAYVQDKEALAMCSLLPGGYEGYSPENAKYYLNTADVGVTPDQLGNYVQKLRRYFLPSDSVPHPNLIFFKFLYSIPGDKPADFKRCWMEYISAYTNVNEIDIENGKIYFKLGAARKWVKWFGNKLKEPNTTNVPRTVCYDFAVNNTDGLLEGDNCDCDYSSRRMIDNIIGNLYKDIIDHNNDFSSVPTYKWVQNVAIPGHLEIVGKIFKGNIDKYSVCKHIDFPRSFLRVPAFNGKRGGGVRVKRLLMYDQGMEKGDAMVYGSEYIYKTEDGLSSGVATNEPQEGREENALVQLLDEKNLSWLGKITYGEDLKQSEGPLGENLLPPPSVGYSRVVIQNIHGGKTGTGYTVYTYHTSKDYPLKYTCTALDNDHKLRIPIMIPAGLFSFNTDKMYLTQGYRFIINEFNGRPAMVANYNGEYVPGNTVMPVSYTKYNYYNLEKQDVPYIQYDPANHRFIRTMGKPGKEEDVTIESKSIHDQSMDFSLDLDLCFSYPAISVSFSFSPSFSFDEKLIDTHVTSTVVRYPAIVKSTVSYSEAGKVITEYLGFNPQTGKPVLTKTNDGYDNVRLQFMNGTKTHNGGYYTWDFPASWIYPEMGPKSSDEKAFRTNQLSVSAGNIVTYGEDGKWIKSDTTTSVEASQFKGVISAAFTTFKNNWFGKASDVISEYNVNTADQTKLNSNWYPNASYVFNTKNVKSANDPDSGRIYNGGIIRDFTMFNWDSANLSPKWLKASEVTSYSPNGNALEEKDILGIYSAVRYGYHGQLPVVMAKNANYSSIYFNDFENDQSAEISTTPCHSGYKSLNLTSNTNYEFVSKAKGVKFDEHLKSKGASIKLWMNSRKNGDPIFSNQSADFSAVVNSMPYTFRKIASLGEWALYEANITTWPAGLNKEDNIIVKLNYAFQAGEEVFIDDFRMQPLDADVSCVVYDVKNYKVLAQFDNQHFGLLYQYNREGQLVRKMVETERGLKTVQEEQYNVTKQSRTQNL